MTTITESARMLQARTYICALDAALAGAPHSPEELALLKAGLTLDDLAADHSRRSAGAQSRRTPLRRFMLRRHRSNNR